MQAEIIDHVKFGILSPEQIRRLSVAKLTVPDTYNEDGYPIDGGLLDQRLGVIDPGLICKSCGARAKVCPGHFGHIDLIRPVVHSEFSKIVYLLLQSTCQQCHRILLNEEQVGEVKGKIRTLVETEINENGVGTEGERMDERDTLFKKLRNIKKCPYCEAVQQKVKFESPTYFYFGEIRLKPDEIRDMLTKITNDDLRVIGIDPLTSRPEWLILSALLVPPVNVRPSITLESGERSEDDLTHKLVDIMRINQRLEQNINAGAPQIIIDDLWELLQYNVTTYFNNETPGIPPARHRSGRALKTLAQRLKGKEGRFRYNLSGKRVNYSARTVISVDPYINIDEVGVPFEIASRLTIPFYVTAWNLEKAKELSERKEYPMVMGVTSRDGKRKRITDINREEVIKAIQVGDILERQVANGDIALFNRQPSLHRPSIMMHKVKVLPSRTFRLNYCTTHPYNADFDGDEMNLHIPQTLEAQAEAEYLMSVKDQIFSPRNGEAIITNNEDGITGMYLLTQDDTKLDKEEASYLLSLADVFELPDKSSAGKYSGKDVFSMLLPKGLDFEQKTKRGVVRIKNGKLLEGVLSKATYGTGSKLLAKISVDFGNDVLKDFISRSGRVAYAYSTTHGITVGIREYLITPKIEEARNKILKDTFAKVQELIVQYKNKKLDALIGHTLKESLEMLIIAELDKARISAGEQLVTHTTGDNHAITMVNAGSRGSILNLVQMSMLLGQQATSSGGRIKRGYMTNRVLPHIVPGDISPVAKGFVTSSYYMGFEPIDMYMHAIGSRTSVVYKAMLTAKSGYLQRRLINALQDYQVEKDFTVRDVHGNIVQTSYGGDSLDPTKLDMAEVAAKE
ncbi:MAG: DNA-directed RNA polymerase subunit A' [Candidatus Micrarchaeota archaeon]|nr:DNA-directed RNA polymerase subunit A' [Candidatus Micrarchaeota archaeon]MDE1847956.1 DNA-directed RNA polymerase subunit A' [Candidatus Micrarchaeota archaeon]MDE1864326.1 DNA-directed RNA polymerase subunit A' [Candidatus Micrarchaeota archaeon]